MSGGINSGNRGAGLVTLDLTAAGAGVSSWIDIPGVAPSNIGFGVQVVSGAPTYSIQHRFGKGAQVSPAFNHPFVVAQTVNADGNYFFPISQIRISMAAAGRVKLFALIPGLNDVNLPAESV